MLYLVRGEKVLSLGSGSSGIGPAAPGSPVVISGNGCLERHQAGSGMVASYSSARSHELCGWPAFALLPD